MFRVFPCVVLAGLVILIMSASAGSGKEKSTTAKKDDIPVDPVQRVAYQYGPMGRFGVTGFLISGKNRTAKLLTFANDGDTNMTVVQVDGNTAEFGGPNGRFTVVPHYKGGKPGQKYFSTGTWVHQQNVAVTQTLDIVPGQVPVEVAPGKLKRLLDTCLVTYVLENRDKKPHKVGLRIEVDTLIGQNDGVPFTVPGLTGLVSTKHDFPTADKVPAFVQAVEVADLKNPGTVAQMSLRVGRGLEPPSRVSLTHWSAGFNGWEVPVRDMANDSSVVLYWDPTELQPKEKRTIGFAYGLGMIATQEGGSLGLTVSGAFEKGGSFVAVATVTKPAPGQKLTLVLPAELERISGKETEPASSGNAKGPSVVTWNIMAKKTGQYRVEVRSSDGASASHTITISEPAPLLKPLGK